MWNWLQSLSGGAATFIGSLTGSAIGLIALLIGAFFNAHLNRRRDDRLRKEDGRAILAALKAELSRIHESLLLNAENLDKPNGDFVVPDIAHLVRIMPHILPKLGLLGVETIKEVIGIYVSIDQYCEALLMRGGRLVSDNRPDRRLISMEEKRASYVGKVNRDLAAMI